MNSCLIFIVKECFTVQLQLGDTENIWIFLNFVNTALEWFYPRPLHFSAFSFTEYNQQNDEIIITN